MIPGVSETVCEAVPSARRLGPEQVFGSTDILFVRAAGPARSGILTVWLRSRPTINARFAQCSAAASASISVVFGGLHMSALST